MFKLLVLLIVVQTGMAYSSTVPLADENPPKGRILYRQALEECRSELNLSNEDMDVLSSKDTLPTTELQSCSMDCLNSKLGLMKDGKLDHDGLVNLFISLGGDEKTDRERAEKIFKKCQPRVDKETTEKCAAGFAFKACLIDAAIHAP